VLATILFIAFWVVLGVGLFVVAARGGLGARRPAAQRPSRRGTRAATILFIVVYLAFGAIVPFTILAGNRASASSQIGGLNLTTAQKHGRTLFGQSCAQCHTLAAANAVGKVGPNLDQLKPPASLVLHTINYGCLQSPPSAGGTAQSCLGQGVMPAEILSGKDAQDVAAFVGRVAGNE
jgi:mono/diheme cytochrome c family protein